MNAAVTTALTSQCSASSSYDLLYVISLVLLTTILKSAVIEQPQDHHPLARGIRREICRLPFLLPPG